MTAPLLKTPLYDIHVGMGARMVEFAGWSMPVQFAGIAEEHHHTRTACSVFDVSHMGRLGVMGGGRATFLNRIRTPTLGGPEEGRSLHWQSWGEDGATLHAVIVSRFED